ncbi:MAG: hypothetical protein EXS48_03575 [Candidatus Staskawiczbacteria bacterium]|nr:hypothetical protein [Candidatus Staskawiczbacteria bacterium]
MLKFFSHIFKNKKIIIFLFLALVIAGIVVPKNVDANIIVVGAAAYYWFSDSDGASDFQAGLNGTKSCGSTDISCAVGRGVRFIISGILFIPLMVTGLFSFIASSLLQAVLQLSVSEVGYTKAPAVIIGWPIVRNFGNMIIVLALIVIALATIIRYQAYEAKKLLPPLIIAALLINFSLVICGVVIDASNIVMKDLLTGGKNNQVAIVGSFISKSEFTLVTEIMDRPATLEVLMSDIAGTVFYFVTRGIVTFLFIFLFLFRIFALWILVILSPLAFACYVLPYTRKMVFDKWLSNFLQWCFIGVFGAIFISLADAIHAGMTKPENAELMRIHNVAATGGFTGSLINFANFFVPGMFLVIGFFFSIQMAPMGSKLAFQAGGWVKDKTMGAVKGTAKYAGSAAANKTGLTGLGNTVADRATRLGERLGFVSAGTAAKREDKRMSDYKSRATAQTSEDLAKDASAKAYTAKGLRQKAAQLLELNKRGDLHMMGDVATQGKALQFASGYSSDPDEMWSKAKKKNPLLQKYNTKKVGEALTKGPKENPLFAQQVQSILQKGRAKDPKFTQRDAEQHWAEGEVVRQAVLKAQPSDAKDWSAETLKNSTVQMALDSSKVRAIERGGNHEAQQVIKDNFGTKKARDLYWEEMRKEGYFKYKTGTDGKPKLGNDGKPKLDRDSTTPEFQSTTEVMKYFEAKEEDGEENKEEDKYASSPTIQPPKTINKPWKPPTAIPPPLPGTRPTPYKMAPPPIPKGKKTP